MKITDKLAQAAPPTFSFEFFVPKTLQGVQNLYDRMDRMYDLNPVFIDITWNAGGRSSSLTNEMVYTAQLTLGLETCMHLTCTNMPVELIDEALSKAYALGCQNILALRGDPPLDGSESTGDFRYAKDLIAHIRRKYGSHFNIGVAGYPEGHPEDTDGNVMGFLKEKVDAGADFIITQMFYDVDNFLKWVGDVRKAGVAVPIVPGVMPISTFAAFERRAKWLQVVIPPHFAEALDPIKEDDFAVREKGADLVADMCKRLVDLGEISHLHFYTMNLERATVMVLERLQLVEVEETSEMPWRKLLHPLRTKETIRPIFWRNRKYSYILRTLNWDEFPNGRWGDSRLPAFGDIDLAATELLRQLPKRAYELWGCPQLFAELAQIHVAYLEGRVKALPWCDGPIGADTGVLREQLVRLNQRGFFTLNSQPAVLAARLADPVHGWGPKNGFVYQKQYLEVLVHQDYVPQLLAKAEAHPSCVTYYAVDKRGTLKTNTGPDDINAVTWGVFPGEEIVQPTIVEKVSFLAWKDEVYRLLDEWARIFRAGAVAELVAPEKAQRFTLLMAEFAELYVLCNFVNNDFTCGNDALFELVELLGAPCL